MSKINLDDMTKEELLVHIREKNKKVNLSRWKKMITLTPSEGKILERDFLPKYNCANVSQFVKKIANGSLIITKN